MGLFALMTQASLCSLLPGSPMVIEAGMAILEIVQNVTSEQFNSPTDEAGTVDEASRFNKIQKDTYRMHLNTIA